MAVRASSKLRSPPHPPPPPPAIGNWVFAVSLHFPRQLEAIERTQQLRFQPARNARGRRERRCRANCIGRVSALSLGIPCTNGRQRQHEKFSALSNSGWLIDTRISRANPPPTPAPHRSYFQLSLHSMGAVASATVAGDCFVPGGERVCQEFPRQGGDLWRVLRWQRCITRT